MMYFFQVAHCIICRLGKCDRQHRFEGIHHTGLEITKIITVSCEEAAGARQNGKAHPTFLCCRELLWGTAGDKLSGVPSGV